jgi:surface protein
MKTSNKVKPENTKELIKIIQEECKEKGWECNLNFIDTSLITNMSELFLRFNVLENFNGDISQWDTSNVTNMSRIFSFSNFNGNIGEWDVSKVKNMKGAFIGSKFNQDISKWDVSKVENMSSMFSESEFNGDISQWDVSSVKSMSDMFSYSKFNKDISGWDVSKVKYMSSMFEESKIEKYPEWKIENLLNVKDMDNIFNQCSIKKPNWYIKDNNVRKNWIEGYITKKNLDKILGEKINIKEKNQLNKI